MEYIRADAPHAEITDLSECDVLALSTLAVKFFEDMVEDADTLSFLADFITAVGESLSLIASQRARIEAKNAQAQTTKNGTGKKQKTK